MSVFSFDRRLTSIPQAPLHLAVQVAIPFWRIDDSEITGDLEAVQDSPTHVSILPRVYNALREIRSSTGPYSERFGKESNSLPLHLEPVPMAWIFSLAAECGSDENNAKLFAQYFEEMTWDTLQWTPVPMPSGYFSRR